MDRKQYFACNPTADELYFTSDGQAFYDANSAGAHAQRLKNRHVECVTRGEVAEETPPSPPALSPEGEEREAAAQKAEAEKKAKAEAAKKTVQTDKPE